MSRDCPRSQELFSDHLDGSLHAILRGELEAHLARCAECRSLREAVADAFRANGYEGLTADRTIVSTGAKGILYLALQVLESDAEVITAVEHRIDHRGDHRPVLLGDVAGRGKAQGCGRILGMRRQLRFEVTAGVVHTDCQRAGKQQDHQACNQQDQLPRKRHVPDHSITRPPSVASGAAERPASVTAGPRRRPFCPDHG